MLANDGGKIAAQFVDAYTRIAEQEDKFDASARTLSKSYTLRSAVDGAYSLVSNIGKGLVNVFSGAEFGVRDRLFQYDTVAFYDSKTQELIDTDLDQLKSSLLDTMISKATQEKDPTQLKELLKDINTQFAQSDPGNHENLSQRFMSDVAHRIADIVLNGPTELTIQEHIDNMEDAFGPLFDAEGSPLPRQQINDAIAEQLMQKAGDPKFSAAEGLEALKTLKAVDEKIPSFNRAVEKLINESLSEDQDKSLKAEMEKFVDVEPDEIKSSFRKEFLRKIRVKWKREVRRKLKDALNKDVDAVKDYIQAQAEKYPDNIQRLADIISAASRKRVTYKSTDAKGKFVYEPKFTPEGLRAMIATALDPEGDFDTKTLQDRRDRLLKTLKRDKTLEKRLGGDITTIVNEVTAEQIKKHIVKQGPTQEHQKGLKERRMETLLSEAVEKGTQLTTQQTSELMRTVEQFPDLLEALPEAERNLLMENITAENAKGGNTATFKNAADKFIADQTNRVIDSLKDSISEVKESRNQAKKAYTTKLLEEETITEIANAFKGLQSIEGLTKRADLRINLTKAIVEIPMGQLGNQPTDPKTLKALMEAVNAKIGDANAATKTLFQESVLSELINTRISQNTKEPTELKARIDAFFETYKELMTEELLGSQEAVEKRVIEKILYQYDQASITAETKRMVLEQLEHLPGAKENEKLKEFKEKLDKAQNSNTDALLGKDGKPQTAAEKANAAKEAEAKTKGEGDTAAATSDGITTGERKAGQGEAPTKKAPVETPKKKGGDGDGGETTGGDGGKTTSGDGSGGTVSARQKGLQEEEEARNSANDHSGSDGDGGGDAAVVGE